MKALYYLWTAISSYTAGICLYMLILRFMGEPLARTDASRLIFWTLPTFLCILIGLYLLAVIILKRLNRYTFWLQTLLFVAISFVPVIIVPILSGFGIFFDASFLVSVEGLLFAAMFACMSLLFSYGVWAGGQNRGRSYLLVSIVLIPVMIAL